MFYLMHLINLTVNYLHRKYGVPLHNFSKIGPEVQATLTVPSRDWYSNIKP